MRWFRFYSDVLDDPKVQRLPGDLFKAWVNLLCLANESEPRGTLPCLEDIAFRLRMTDEEADTVIRELRKRGLLDVEDDGLQPHNWDGRQPPSDDVSKRVQKYREKQQQPVTRNVTRNVTETSQNRIDKTRLEETREDENMAPAAHVRALDPLFESVVQVCYHRPHSEITDDERGRVNKALPQLRRVKATPQDVFSRADEYERRSPDYPLTPQTLTKSWSDLAISRAAARASPTPLRTKDGRLTPAGIMALDTNQHGGSGSIFEVEGRVKHDG